MFITVVDNCPKCNSEKTGYYVKGSDKSAKIRAYRKGERIRFFDIYDNYYKNTFCTECKFRWHSDLHKQWIGKKEFRQHLIDKGFIEERDNVYKNALVSEKEKKEETKEEKLLRKELNWNKVSVVLNMITGINIKRHNPYTLKRIKDEIEEVEE